MIYKCPVPGCIHVGEVITANHYEMYHHMTREQVKQKYGTPVVVKMDMALAKLNLEMMTKGRAWRGKDGKKSKEAAVKRPEKSS